MSIFKRDNSVEKQARRALRRLMFYRFLGEVFSLPQFLLRSLSSLLLGLSKWLNRLELSVFCLEQDAARRYTLLTGFDLGAATGEPGRYAAAVNPATQELLQETFLREALDPDGP